MSTTADDVYRQIATDQGKLTGLSESGIKLLITEMQKKLPDPAFLERLLNGITLLNLENVKSEVTEEGYKLLIATVRKNPKITSFNFNRTCLTYLGSEFGLPKWRDIQYIILYFILKDDSRPIKLLDLSHSSMKGHSSRPRADVVLGVNGILPILKSHRSIGSLYLRNVPQYQQLWNTAETQIGGREESEWLAEQLSELLKVVPVQHLDIEGAGIPIEDVIRALRECPMESLNVSNNLINPDAFPSLIQILKQSESLRSLTMSNMKFVTMLKRTRPQVENVKMQEKYLKEFKKELAGIEEIVAMKRIKQGSSSSASSSSSSSSSSSTLSASIPFLSFRPLTTKRVERILSFPPLTTGRVEQIKKTIPQLSIKEMEELSEYLKKHLSEARNTTAMELDESDIPTKS